MLYRRRFLILSRESKVVLLFCMIRFGHDCKSCARISFKKTINFSQQPVFPSAPSALQAPTGLRSRPSRASASSRRARASVLGESLPSKRVTVGPYSPLRIGNSRTVHAVLTRHPQSSLVFCTPRELRIGPVHYLQSSPVICSPHLSYAVLPNYL